MKSRTRRLLIVCAILLTLALAAAVCYRCFKRDSAGAEVPEEFKFKGIRVVEAQAVLAECPEASSAILVGKASAPYVGIFDRAGVFTAGVREPDIVFAAGDDVDGRRLTAIPVATNGVYAWAIDTRELTVDGFRRKLASFNLPTVRLWMAGEHDWILIGRRAGDLARLASMLDRFGSEGSQADLVEASCETLPELFASYVGTRADILPAFSGNLKQPVRPEFFITQEIPDFGWIDRSEVDEDISDTLIGDIHEAQIARRLTVEGNMLALADGKMEEAIDRWIAALRRNPHDTMLLDRLYRLAVNARTFERVGNFKAAAKCYETMVSVRPNDAAAMAKFGECMKMLGDKKIAEAALKKAEEMTK